MQQDEAAGLDPRKSRRAAFAGNHDDRKVRAEPGTQSLDGIDAIFAVAQTIIDNDRVGIRVAVKKRNRFGSASRDDGDASPLHEQGAHAFANLGFIVHDGDSLSVEIAGQPHRMRRTGADIGGIAGRQQNAKHRSPAKARIHFHVMPEQAPQTADDGEAQSKSARAIAFRVSELVELLEDAFAFAGWNTRPGVPYFDRDAATTAATPEYHATMAVCWIALLNRLRRMRSSRTGSERTTRGEGRTASRRSFSSASGA